MSINLLESIKGEISSGAIDKISNYLGESRSATSNAITGAIPLILLYLSNKAKTERGAENLMSFTSDNSFNALFDGSNFQEAFEKNRDTLLSKGNVLVSSVFGSTDEQKITQGIADYANISTESVKSALTTILPLVIGSINQKVNNENLSGDRLTAAFDDERYKAAIPAALTKSLGSLGIFANLKGETATVNVEEPLKNTDLNTKTNASMKEQDDRKVYIKEDEDKGGIMKWLLPLLALVLGIIALIFLLKQCDDDKDVVTEGVDTPALVDSADIDNDGNQELVDVNEIKGTYDAEKNSFVYDTGNERTITLPDGTTFTVGEASTEAKIYDFLNNDALVVSDDKSADWITMDRIYFSLNEATLIPDSEQQLNNVAAILKNYPNAQVKFGGYTDNQGGQEINQPLSDARAKSALDYVVAKGIDASRLESEGYGQDHFLCPANDTPECLAKNRRVDVRITKK